MEGWIKCDDRLPVNNNVDTQFFVLLKINNSSKEYAAEVAFYDGNYKFGEKSRGWWRFDDDIEPYELKDVVAWMDVPEMPEDV